MTRTSRTSPSSLPKAIKSLPIVRQSTFAVHLSVSSRSDGFCSAAVFAIPARLACLAAFQFVDPISPPGEGLRASGDVGVRGNGVVGLGDSKGLVEGLPIPATPKPNRRECLAALQFTAFPSSIRPLFKRIRDSASERATSAGRKPSYKLVESSTSTARRGRPGTSCVASVSGALRRVRLGNRVGIMLS